MKFKLESFENENYRKYNGDFYKPESITHLPVHGSKEYAQVLASIRVELAAQYAQNSVVLDLCCGTGEYLLHFASVIKEGKGLDFSAPFIQRANETKTRMGFSNVEFYEGNAREMPFVDGYFNLVYCFASLYHIPKVEEVISEIARVLKPQGKCVLDMGNQYSLNTIACRAYPDVAHSFHISLSKMKKILRANCLTVLNHRSFQILPLWADRPKWMSPLLWPGWTKILARQIGGKMLDEWISSLPILKYFAFRQVFVCQKE